MQNFIHENRPGRVVFGPGRAGQLPAELDALGVRRALVLTTPEQAALGQHFAGRLGERCVGVYAKAQMHVPVEVARAAVDVAREAGADACVAIGGGSTIGLAKAIALESTLPIIAVPTTYAGSEMTPLYGLTEGGMKKTGRDWRVLPRSVVYDPELTVSLPVALSITSGMNAIAHAAEGLYAGDGSPIYKLMAEEGIRALAAALPLLHHDGTHAAARSDALYGAWLCGVVLGNVQMGVHHKICHTLGGSFNLPHSEVHTVILPHALAYNAAAAPEAMRAIGRALDPVTHPEAIEVPRALHGMARRIGAPMTLRDIGMDSVDLDRAAELIVLTPYPNPRAIERDAIRALLQRAFEGVDPT